MRRRKGGETDRVEDQEEEVTTLSTTASWEEISKDTILGCKQNLVAFPLFSQSLPAARFPKLKPPQAAVWQKVEAAYQNSNSIRGRAPLFTATGFTVCAVAATLSAFCPRRSICRGAKSPFLSPHYPNASNYSAQVLRV